jgi:glutamate dehydrogenase/leucine dehydrogenase
MNKLAYVEGYMQKEAEGLMGTGLDAVMGIYDSLKKGVLFAPPIMGALGGIAASKLTSPSDDEIDVAQGDIVKHEWSEAVESLKTRIAQKKEDKEHADKQRKERGIKL